VIQLRVRSRQWLTQARRVPPTARKSMKTVAIDNANLYGADRWAYDFVPEDLPVTLHLVLPTANPGELVWVADRLARVGPGSISSIDKIVHLPVQKAACSMWGDFNALRARDEFVTRARNGSVSLEDPDVVTQVLKEIADECIPKQERERVIDRLTRGVIVVTFGPPVRIYQATVTWPAGAFVAQWLIAGDLQNPANLFATHYYDLCKKSIGEVLFVGIHSMLLARQLNRQGVGPPDPWVLKNGVFKQLTMDELLSYIKLSAELDDEILRRLLDTPNL
jgi:hypothetical protein